jgi:hypothetical protein
MALQDSKDVSLNHPLETSPKYGNKDTLIHGQTMCYTHHFRSRNCGHHWLQIAQPCAPGFGFRVCDTFGDGVAREPSPQVSVGALCPACSLGEAAYDRNLVRMIMDIRDRWRWGRGPCKHEAGIECVVL